jgi:ribosomal-protein-alanine N-acetyltransferase
MGGVVLNIASDPKTEEAIGFSLVRSVADEAELLLLAVLPDRHRQGTGGRLLDHFIREAELGGVTRIHLEVRDGNPAVQMYRNAGFEPVGRRRNYYQAADGARYDAITFAKNL